MKHLKHEPGLQTNRGSGVDDGDGFHLPVDPGELNPADLPSKRGLFFFGQLVCNHFWTSMLVRKTPTHGEAAQQKRTLPRFPKQQCDLGRHANLPVMGGSSSNSRKGDLRLRPCRKKGTEKAKSEAKFGD